MTTSSNNPESAKSHLPSAEAMAKRRRRRYFSDGAARWMVRAGGGGVVVALALIFVYLFSEVVPLLQGASIESSSTLGAPDGRCFRCRISRSRALRRDRHCDMPPMAL